MKTIFLLFLSSFIALFSFANLYIVTDTSASSPQSLAYAIDQANAHLGLDTIEFNIPGGGIHEINSDSISNITDTVLINGLSQQGNIATDYSNATIRIKGNKGLSIHSAGCSIIGIGLTNTANITALEIVADSGKSCSHTLIKRFFYSTNIFSHGIKISTDSLGLSSNDIHIDSSKILGKTSGIEITTNVLTDLNGIQITNNELRCGYWDCVYYEHDAISITRICSFPTNPEFELMDNIIDGHIFFRGYLDSLYLGSNVIYTSWFNISYCSINNIIIEGNEIYNGDGYPDNPFHIHDFLNDTIRNIRIQNNSIDGLDFRFSFNGNNQYFDSIIFSGNELTTLEVSFEKTTVYNLDSQIVKNLIVNNNTCSNGTWHVLLLFKFSGRAVFSNVQIENNDLISTYTYLVLESDSMTRIKSIYINGNYIFCNQFSWLMYIKNNGFIDTLIISGNSFYAYNSNIYLDGLRLESNGLIDNLKIKDNYFVIEGPDDAWGISSSGVIFYNINAKGEISHNTFANCSSAGITVYNYTGDSATALLIDSNIIYGSYHNAISINTGPYTPPSQGIGRYTALGNSIYNIGKDGIYRSSQHDTASCMSCIPKPMLVNAEYDNGFTIVNGTLTGDTLTNYIIEFFSNSSPDTGGYTEGHTFIHRDTITTDATGNAIFSSSIQGNFLDSFITSTATSMVTYQTSEFSNETGVVLGTPDTENANEITVFPNPVSQDLFIYSPTRPLFQIDIIDLLGKRTNMEFSDPHSSKINLQNFLPGFYFLEIHFDDKTIIRKILKD